MRHCFDLTVPSLAHNHFPTIILGDEIKSDSERRNPMPRNLDHMANFQPSNMMNDRHPAAQHIAWHGMAAVQELKLGMIWGKHDSIIYNWWSVDVTG